MFRTGMLILWNLWMVLVHYVGWQILSLGVTFSSKIKSWQTIGMISTALSLVIKCMAGLEACLPRFDMLLIVISFLIKIVFMGCNEMRDCLNPRASPLVPNRTLDWLTHQLINYSLFWHDWKKYFRILELSHNLRV